jgi:hypothetical protein
MNSWLVRLDLDMFNFGALNVFSSQNFVSVIEKAPAKFRADPCFRNEASSNHRPKVVFEAFDECLNSRSVDNSLLYEQVFKCLSSNLW